VRPGNGSARDRKPSEHESTFASAGSRRAPSRFGAGAAIAFLLLLAWEVGVRVLEVHSPTIPSPSRVFLELLKEALQLKEDAWITGIESLEGLLLALMAGFLLAVLDTTSKSLHRFTAPALSFLQKMPLIALAPLIVTWVGFGTAPAVAVAFLLCVPPLAASIRGGFDAAPHEILEVLQAMDAPRLKTLWKVRVPWCLPFLSSGIKTAIPLALAGATVAEFVGSTAGLGYTIVYGASRTEAAPLLAALTVLALIALISYGIVRFLEQTLMTWAGSLPGGTFAGQIPDSHAFSVDRTD
jgi:NitT/TauT family transport system permease protein